MSIISTSPPSQGKKVKFYNLSITANILQGSLSFRVDVFQLNGDSENLAFSTLFFATEQSRIQVKKDKSNCCKIQTTSWTGANYTNFARGLLLFYLSTKASVVGGILNEGWIKSLNKDGVNYKMVGCSELFLATNSRAFR